MNLYIKPRENKALSIQAKSQARLLRATEKEIDKFGFTWQTDYFDGSTLELKLVFEDPLSISKDQKDRLVIEFNNPFLHTPDGMIMLPTRTEKHISEQLPPEGFYKTAIETS